MLKKGFFISFEGADGTGKSTQIAKTSDHLKQRGFDVVITREPGGSAISELIRNILLDPQNSQMVSQTEAYLYAAARAQHVAEVIKPALIKGSIVVSDRYIDSSLAYQGHARGLGIDNVFEVNKMAVDEVMPDVTFYLDLPTKTAMDRRENERELDRIEQSGLDFMDKVYEAYRLLAKRYGDRISVINAIGTQDEVFAKIKDVLNKKLI